MSKICPVVMKVDLFCLTFKFRTARLNQISITAWISEILQSHLL